jgi:PAS domain-containing protein
MIDGAGNSLLQTSMTQGLILFEVVCDSSGQLVDLRFLEFNPNLTEFNELTCEAIQGKTIREAFPDIEDHWFEAFNRIFLTGIPANFAQYSSATGGWYQVYAFVPKPGRLAVVFQQIVQPNRTQDYDKALNCGVNLINSTLNFNEMMQKSFVIANTHLFESMQREITEHQETQVALQESQRQITQILDELRDRDFCLRLALEAGKMGWFDYRPLTKELIHDQTCAAIWGLGPGEHQDINFFWSSLNPGDVAPIKAAMEAAFDPNQNYHFQVEYRIRPADGSPERWIRATSKTIFAGEGEARQAVRQIGTLQDITARKVAEEQIQQQNAVLEGINRILQETLICKTEADLGQVCLTVAKELTRSLFGFIGELSPDGRFEEIALQILGSTAEPPLEIKKIHFSGLINSEFGGIFRSRILAGEPFLTNDLVSYLDSPGLPEGHPPLRSFLCFPLTRISNI